VQWHIELDIARFPNSIIANGVNWRVARWPTRWSARAQNMPAGRATTRSGRAQHAGVMVCMRIGILAHIASRKACDQTARCEYQADAAMQYIHAR